MNIADGVRHLKTKGHSTLHVPALDVWLGHLDDPYSLIGARSAQLLGVDQNQSGYSAAGLTPGLRQQGDS